MQNVGTGELATAADCSGTHLLCPSFSAGLSGLDEKSVFFQIL